MDPAGSGVMSGKWGRFNITQSILYRYQSETEWTWKKRSRGGVVCDGKGVQVADLSQTVLDVMNVNLDAVL